MRPVARAVAVPTKRHGAANAANAAATRLKPSDESETFDGPRRWFSSLRLTVANCGDGRTTPCGFFSVGSDDAQNLGTREY